MKKEESLLKLKLKGITSKILNKRTVSMATVLLVVFSISGIPEEVCMIKTSAVAAETAKVKNVNLGVGGISNPLAVSSASSLWSSGYGHYVYFGNYFQNSVINKEPIKWRVLSTTSDSTGNTSGMPNSLLLMSDKVLDNVRFNDGYQEKDGISYKEEKGVITDIVANNYIYSNVNYWLNSTKKDGKYLYEDIDGYGYTQNGFYDNAFSEYEKNAVNTTTKEKKENIDEKLIDSELIAEKVFLLSIAELDNPLYGFAQTGSNIDYNVTRRLLQTNYVKTAYGINGTPQWLTRTISAENSQRLQYVYEGNFAADAVAKKNSGITPAINLNKASVSFVTEAGFDKLGRFDTTMDGSKIKEWVVAIKNNDGFEASLSEGSLGMVVQGGKLKVSVNKLPQNASDYTQISAMLVDETETVVAYGRILEEAKTGEAVVTIPYGIDDGKYTLRVFAEDVNSSDTVYTTDYVSNMADIQVTIDSNNLSIQDMLEDEKQLKHNIVAKVYNTADYANGGAGQQLTSAGIDVTNWQHSTSKYIQIDVDMHASTKEDHTVRVKLPRELYFVGDLSVVPAGCSDVTFEVNEDMMCNGGSVKYDVNAKSGTLVYYIEPNITKTSIQVEVRYDKVLWDKLKNSQVTADNVIPVDVSVNYEANKGEYLEGGELAKARIKKITAGNPITRHGWFVYNSDRYDLSKSNTKDLSMSVIEANQVRDVSYFPEGVFEIHMPYWTDEKGVRHYLDYDINTFVWNKSFFIGNMTYDVIEQNEAVVKIRVKDLLYTTATQMVVVPLTFPKDLVTEHDFITFSNGKYKLTATSNNGKKMTPFDLTINSVKYASRYIERVILESNQRGMYLNMSKLGITQLGGFYLSNEGIAPSTPKDITVTFPKELLITTINLPADNKAEYYYVKYKLYDEDSKEVYLDEYDRPVAKNSPHARDTWTIMVKNPNYNKSTLDNTNVCFKRNMLPEGQRRYFFRQIIYTLETIRPAARLYVHSGRQGLTATGNYYGYFGKGAKTNGQYYTNVLIKSPQESKIADINVNVRVTASTSYTTAYGIDSVKFSKSECKAGESVNLSGSILTTSYPYGSSSKMDGIRLALVLSNQITLDQNNIVLKTNAGQNVKVEKVTKKDIGNLQTLWTIDADPTVYIGYANENLGGIANGYRMDFTVSLKTSKRMEYASIFTESTVFCAGRGVVNAASGSYQWANQKDIYDLNQNGSTTDGIGRMAYNNTTACNIVPSPPSLDITDSLEVDGKGSVEKGIANMVHKNDIVKYRLNIASLDDGRASEFKYYIPIPKSTTSRDEYFMLSSKDNSFDMELIAPGKVSGDELYTIEYCYDKGLSYDEVSKLKEDRWFTEAEIKSLIKSGIKGGAYKWENVTMVRLKVEGFIEKGVDSTIELQLMYAGNNFNQDAGQKNVWRSSGYYVYDSGIKVLSGNFKSSGVSAQVKFSWNYTEELQYIARANTDPNKINMVANSFPNNLDKKDINKIPQINGAQNLKITDIGLNNVELKSKKFMLENQNTLTPDEANQYFAFELVIGTGAPIDLSDGIDQTVGKIHGNKIPTMNLVMYYGSRFNDVMTNRSVTLTMETDKGMNFTIVANIYFVSKNNIKVLNGEDSYYRDTGVLTKVFYSYEMKNEIIGKEDIEFEVDQTNDIVEITFALSTSKHYSDWTKYIPRKYLTVTDENGIEVKPSILNTYRIEGGRRYTLSISREYLMLWYEERNPGNIIYQTSDINTMVAPMPPGHHGVFEPWWEWGSSPWWEYQNTGGDGGMLLYLHAHVPTMSSTQEILLLKRRLFTMN